MAGALAAAVLPLTLTTSADAAADTPSKKGKGTGACPAQTLCVYEHKDYNASGPARIWLFAADGAAYREWNLKGRSAADKGRSAYNNLKEHRAWLRVNGLRSGRGTGLPNLSGSKNEAPK
ncbi:peptidase inhibitor family I36 protein [Streptomyces sp. NPDC002073]